MQNLICHPAINKKALMQLNAFSLSEKNNNKIAGCAFQAMAIPTTFLCTFGDMCA